MASRGLTNWPSLNESIVEEAAFKWFKGLARASVIFFLEHTAGNGKTHLLETLA